MKQFYKVVKIVEQKCKDCIETENQLAKASEELRTFYERGYPLNRITENMEINRVSKVQRLENLVNECQFPNCFRCKRNEVRKD